MASGSGMRGIVGSARASGTQRQRRSRQRSPQRQRQRRQRRPQRQRESGPIGSDGITLRVMSITHRHQCGPTGCEV